MISCVDHSARDVTAVAAFKSYPMKNTKRLIPTKKSIVFEAHGELLMDQSSTMDVPVVVVPDPEDDDMSLRAMLTSL